MRPPESNHPPTPGGTCRQGGFTLVEIVLAIGIFAFAMASILGVMPTALDGIQQSSTQQKRAELLAALSSEVMTSSENGGLAAVQNLGFPRYFDALGVPSSQANAVYEATLSTPGNVTLDGTSLGDSLQRGVVTLKSLTSNEPDMTFPIYLYTAPVPSLP